MIQMGDQTVSDFSGDPAFRNRFLKIMRELGPLVREAQEHKDAEAEPQSAPAEVSAEPDPMDEAAASLNAALGEYENDDIADIVEKVEETPPTPKVNTIPPPPKPDGSMPGDLPRYSLDESPDVVKKRGVLGRTKTEYKPVPELNIAAAIQSYLQHKLVHTPEFAGRSIHVLSSPDGGVNIEVDGKVFEAVGDVTDTEVRAFLTATIAEWQERNI
jgi:hypothetical protein